MMQHASRTDDTDDTGATGDTGEPARSLVQAAIDELAALRSPDPSAMVAMAVVDLMLHNLRAMWLSHQPTSTVEPEQEL